MNSEESDLIAKQFREGIRALVSEYVDPKIKEIEKTQEVAINLLGAIAKMASENRDRQDVLEELVKVQGRLLRRMVQGNEIWDQEQTQSLIKRLRRLEEAVIALRKKN